MEDDNTHLKFSNKHKMLNFNLTLVKNKVHSANLFNSLLNIEDLSEPKKIQEKSRCYLLVKKINIKDKSNSYYSKALNKIFNDVNKYLDHNYERKKVIVGKDKDKEKEIKEDILSQPQEVVCPVLKLLPKTIK